jgi:sRNA-binding regulator protein Hfq
MVNRKLVRPNLAEIKERFSHARVPGNNHGENHHARETPNNGATPRRRLAPPEQTNAEAFYYLKQMNAKTTMVVVLSDGQELRGHIEWYDRSCLKVHRDDAPNLLVYKHNIKYMYKVDEEDRV